MTLSRYTTGAKISDGFPVRDGFSVAWTRSHRLSASRAEVNGIGLGELSGEWLFSEEPFSHCRVQTSRKLTRGYS